MTSAATIFAKLVLDSQEYIKGLNKSKTDTNTFTKQGQSSLGGLGTAFKSLTGFSLGAAGAFATAGNAVRFVINEAMEAEKSEKRLETALTSTGYAAGMTKQSLMDYATSLSQVTVNSEETIMDAESLMLTFTKISKDVFPEAMTAAMDMSAAFGNDLQASVIQLGKALNDPSGMAAMKKIGVSFSEAQITMAKSMFEAGDVAGYQKLIIKELNTEVGGMAKAMGTTYAGQVAILKNNMGELGETVGKALIPYLTDASKALNGLLTIQSYYEGMVKDAPKWMSKQGIAYDDYTNRVMDTAIATGDLTKRQKEMYQLYSKNDSMINNAWVDDMNKKLGIVNETVYKAYGITDDYIEIWRVLPQVVQPAAELTEEEIQKINDATTTLSENLIGQVGMWSDMETSYTETLDGLYGDRTDLETEYQKLKKAGWSEQSEKVKGVLSQMDEVNQKIADEKAAYELKTNTVILGYMQEKLAADGILTDDEAQWLIEKGVEWGVYADTAVQAYKDASKSADDFLKHRENAEKDKTVHVKYVVEGGPSVVAVPSGQTNNNGHGDSGNNVYTAPRIPGINGANGLDFIVPYGYPNDSFPVNVQSGEHVQVTPPGQSQSAFSSSQYQGLIKELKNSRVDYAEVARISRDQLVKWGA